MKITACLPQMRHLKDLSLAQAVPLADKIQNIRKRMRVFQFGTNRGIHPRLRRVEESREILANQKLSALMLKMYEARDGE